jgi:hypothetical protein
MIKFGLKMEREIANMGLNMMNELGDDELPASPYGDVIKKLREAMVFVKTQDGVIADLTYQNKKLDTVNAEITAENKRLRDALVASHLEKYCVERGSV